MLPLVSEKVQEDGPATDPKYGRHYDLAPPVELADIHLFTQGQPYEAFALLRDQAPVCWHTEPFHGQADGPGFWAVTRYQDVRAVELDTETYSSQKGGINMTYGAPETRHPLLYPATLNTMISLDQPYHIPLRREHMPFFTPTYVRALF